jgi:hypothetical protein
LHFLNNLQRVRFL